ncbi:MAG: hypothetical protein AAF462_08345 [Thermodesulfobacteriota bacterium]
MITKIKKVLSISLILALSINFVLYSSQSYSPPKAESVSYSIVNCPSHHSGHHASNVIQLFFTSESEEGAEKDCFCYDCCPQRISSFITTKTFTLKLNRYSYHTSWYAEAIQTKDRNVNLPIRSPPFYT